jgi:hypothetical protein
MKRALPGIFEKVRLRPSQLRTVADRRLEDAEYLRRSKQNARANGAMYLGGFAIECLLKARLLEKHRWLQRRRAVEALARSERQLWNLCYRSHDLTELLNRLPEVTARLAVAEAAGRASLKQQLREACEEWTVFARYSPRMATITQAAEFLNKIREIKPWLL